MTKRGINVERITFLGPNQEPATVEFPDDVSVVCGASDTGKSFLVESIDYLLGGSGPLRDIPQRVGYDRIRLQLRTLPDDQLVTLERSVDGGGFRQVDGSVPDAVLTVEGNILKEHHKHERKDNLSGWLLEKIGLYGKRIRKNKDGATLSLSFRNLTRFILIDETDIIERTSPFHTGQYTTRTSEYATLKVLLTGVDDSALVSTEVDKGAEQATGAKLELIDALIEDIEADVADLGADESELADQFRKLDETIGGVEDELRLAQADIDETVQARRLVVAEAMKRQARIDEIDELVARFDLLEQHYQSDTYRLQAIREAGTMLAYVEAAPCPLCGTPPEEQSHRGPCDGDVAAVVSGADAELQKISQLSDELKQTRVDLLSERSGLVGEVSDSADRVRDLGARMERMLAPVFNRTQSSFRDLADKRSSVARGIELYARLARLRLQREDILDESEDDSVSQPTATVLSKSVLEQYSAVVEQILRAWNFPAVGQVYFDDAARDFVIGGKPRGSYGKGFRAITHAAVKIALMKYCLDKNLPHPGFVMLDSPLLAYWKPEGPGDSLEGSDLKERFYQYLASGSAVGQVIVVENEHPTSAVSAAATTVFSRNPDDGRFGLFPLP